MHVAGTGPLTGRTKHKSTNFLFKQGNTQGSVLNKRQFFLQLGKRIRELRKKQGHSQEDMISFGFSARHWQQIEAGRPITVSTLLRICTALKTSLELLVQGLDGDSHEN